MFATHSQLAVRPARALRPSSRSRNVLKIHAAKGFGAGGKTVEAVPCPCGSGGTFASCCKVYHSGEATPATPTALMRARFSAYSRNLPEYIMDTLHPDHPQLKKSRGQYLDDVRTTCQKIKFSNLTVLAEATNPENADEAVVKFSYHSKVTETSRFMKDQGKWLFLDSTEPIIEPVNVVSAV